MDLNKAQVIGNITTNIELKQAKSGNSFCVFTVATNSRYTDGNGEVHEKAEFHNCIANGKTAEIIAQYCYKGQKVYVEGSLQTDMVEKDGVKRYYTKIKVKDIIVLSKREANHQNKYEDEDDILVDDTPF